MAGHHEGSQDNSHVSLVWGNILLEVRVEVEHQQPADNRVHMRNAQRSQNQHHHNYLHGRIRSCGVWRS